MKRLDIKALAGHCFRRTTLISVGGVSFLLGVLYAPYGRADWPWLLPALFFFYALKNKGLLALTIIAYGAFIGGTLRGGVVLQKEEPFRQFLGQKVTLDAVITEDGHYDDKKRIVFTANAFKLLSPDEVDLDVPVRVNTFILSSAARGEVVRVSGKLTPTLGNVAGSIGFAEVETIGTTASVLDRGRQNFTAGLRNALPEPDASFASGILIGQRSSLTKQWQDILRDSSLTHIIAVSGYNLTILVRFSKRLLKNKSRYQILFSSGLLVSGFVLITGISPSILRAIIVVTLLQLCWFYGRKIHPIVLLALAAAISAFIDPFQMWRSVGWYLSFAAFFGVIVLAPTLVPKKYEKSLFAALIAESIAAGIMTLPIIAAVFGRVSVVGLVANLVVSPLVPFAMALSFIAGIAGWVLPSLAGWFGIPAHLLISFMLDIANIVSRLPGARIGLKAEGWQLGVLYTALCAIIWGLYKRRSPRRVMLE